MGGSNRSLQHQLQPRPRQEQQRRRRRRGGRAGRRRGAACPVSMLVPAREAAAVREKERARRRWHVNFRGGCDDGAQQCEQARWKEEEGVVFRSEAAADVFIHAKCSKVNQGPMRDKRSHERRRRGPHWI